MNRCETITTEERDKKEEMKNSYEQVRDYNNRGERQKGRDETQQKNRHIKETISIRKTKLQINLDDLPHEYSDVILN